MLNKFRQVVDVYASEISNAPIIFVGKVHENSQFQNFDFLKYSIFYLFSALFLSILIIFLINLAKHMK